MGRHSCAMLLGVALAIATPLTARAEGEKARSLQLYRTGRRQYEAGDYAEAVASFRAAYDAHPASEYLFNIAQSYRKLGDCPRALAYYRRFRQSEPPDEAKQVADRHIEILSTECGDQESTLAPQTPAPVPPRDTEVDVSEPAPTTTAAPTPPSWRLFAAAGPTLHDIGEVDVPVGIGVHMSVELRLPIELDPVALAAGISAELSPMAYEHTMAGTAVVVGAFASASATVELPGPVRLRGTLGVGDLIVAGLGDGNPFTADELPASGLHMVAGRVEAGVELALSRRLVIAISPELVYAWAHPDLANDIDRVVRASLLVGIGYGL